MTAPLSPGAGARWMLAFSPGAPSAVLRLKPDTTLWQERSQEGSWRIFNGEPAIIVDVSDQMAGILDALVLINAQAAAYAGQWVPLGFRASDQQLVVVERDKAEIVVNTQSDFAAALANRHFGRAFAGCGK